MKKWVLLWSGLFTCGFLSGCSSDVQGDAISSVIGQMQAAASDITNIADEVDKAIKKHDQDKEKAPLDLTEAAKLAKNLEETGIKTQKVKINMVDHARVVDKEEKAELERRFKDRITGAFGSLMEAKKKLNEALQRADAIDHDKVEELRTAIRQAEGQFQTLSRQS